MDIIEISLLFSVVLPLICIAAMVKVCKGIRACYSHPEYNDIFERGKKAADGFKVAAFFLFVLPPIIVLLLLLLMGASPRSHDQSGVSGVMFIFGIFGSIGLFVPFLVSLFGYNYLFLAKDNRTAGLILAIPFLPVVFSIAFAFVAGDFSIGILVLSIFSLHIISWIVMQCLLVWKRKSFDAC